MKLDALKKIYKYDDSKKLFVVEISLDYYLELFNAWDAATLRKRDLDPELVAYLENVAEDIPLKENLQVNFIMPKRVFNEKTEYTSRQVFINYFSHMIHLNRRDMKKTVRQSIIYMITGFFFITIAYLTQGISNVPFEIFSQGLFIGGWVFIWEAISGIFFKLSSLRNTIKRYQRFVDSEIIYIYK